MSAKRGRDPEATKAALLEAAEKIFLKKGFGNTSLSDIAREAQMTKSLIHHYFGSKEGLWHEVKYRRFSAYIDQQYRMLEDQPATVDLLSDSFRFYFHYLKHNPEVVRVMAWIFLECDQSDCFHKEKLIIDAGADKIREVQAQGKLRADIDPRIILFVFTGMAQHWFQDREHFLSEFCRDGIPQGDDLDEVFLESAAKIFFEGILPRKH